MLWGISVRGPYHRDKGMPNQDSWMGNINRTSAWISVCDGMGSRPEAQVGALSACQSVREAVRIWAKVEHVPAHFLPRLVRLTWETKLSKHSVKDCATTCLFACVLPDGRVVVAGLGDGLAVVRLAGTHVERVIERGSCFGNQTLVLGEKHTLDDWKIWEADRFESGSLILLATDGIADDLDTGKLPEFLDWLQTEFGALPPRQRYLSLQKMLVQWPTRLHSDDKTLAVLYCRA